MEIVYTTRRIPEIKGRVFRNPNVFNGPEKDAKKIYIDGTWPNIADAYKAAKVSVSPLSDLRKAEEKAAPAKT